MANTPGVRCKEFTPGWFRGRWRDWHRGHGCHLDDGRPRSPEAAAELAAHAADHLPNTPGVRQEFTPSQFTPARIQQLQQVLHSDEPLEGHCTMLASVPLECPMCGVLVPAWTEHRCVASGILQRERT